MSDNRGYESATVTSDWPCLAIAFRLAEIAAIQGAGQYVRPYIDREAAAAFAESAARLIRAVQDAERPK